MILSLSCDGCWHSWHKWNFSVEDMMPPDVLRRPLLSVFDIFRHGFTHPPIKKRKKKKTACERLLFLFKDSVVAKWSLVKLTSKNVIQWLNRTCTRFRPVRLNRRGPLVFLSHRPTMSRLYLHGKCIHPPPVDATEQRPGFTGDWLPFVITSRILLNVCFTGFWRRGTLSLEREQRFKSVEWCHCYVETWKYTVALWPWKKSSTRVAYGGFVQAYGRVWLAPFSWRPRWGGLQQAIHKSCWSAFLSTWELE